MEIKKELEAYIKETRSIGFKDDDIRMHLKAIGWRDEDIDAALKTSQEATNISRTADAVSFIGGAESDAPLAPPGEGQKSPRVLRTSFILFIVCGSILILGGGAYGGYSYWYNRPENVLLQKERGMQNVLSYSYSAHLQTAIEIKNGSGFLNGENALSTEQPPASKRIDIEGTVRGTTSHSTARDHFEGQNEIQFKATYEGVTAIISMESRTIDDHFYFRITEMPLPLADVRDLKGQWIEYSDEEFQKFLQHPDIAPYLDETQFKEERLRMQERNERLSDIWQKVVTGIWEDIDWYHFNSRFSDEIIDGIKVFHYEMAVDDQALQDALIEMIQMLIEEALAEGTQTLDQTEMEEMKKQMRESITDFFARYVSFEPLEYYIGKEDRLPYRIAGGFAIKDEEIGHLRFQGTIDYRDYNQPLAVEAPESAKSFVDVFIDLTAEAERQMLESQLQSFQRQAEYTYYNKKMNTFFPLLTTICAQVFKIGWFPAAGNLLFV